MNKNILRTLAVVALLAPIGFASAVTPVPGSPVALPGQDTVTVTLEVDATNYPSATLREFTTCEVTVPAGAAVAAVLDKATLDGCIAGWTFVYYATTLQYGRFVTGVDGRQANCDLWATWLVGQDPPACTYWTYTENGGTPNGVDVETVDDGAVYTFLHNVIVAADLP